MFYEKQIMRYVIRRSKSLQAAKRAEALKSKLGNCKTAGNFSKRCNETAMATNPAGKLQDVMTMVEIARYLRDYPTTSVSIEGHLDNTMYMATSTLDSEKLAVRHMWQFHLKPYENICPSAGFIVTHIVPMYEYELKYNNVLFVLDIPKPDKKTNCCF